MGSVREFSDQMIEVAERLANVADAANGRGVRRSRLGIRWLALPAAGAGLYALATSDSVTTRVRGTMDGARARASELPDDLLARVQQAVGSVDGRRKDGGGQPQRARSGGGNRRGSSKRTRSRKTTSNR
jgi:hypothetical protein